MIHASNTIPHYSFIEEVTSTATKFELSVYTLYALYSEVESL